MKKSFLSIALFMCFFIGFTSIEAKATFTVATFADPSNYSGDPLFEVDFIEMTFNGGWSDAKTGLHLSIPYNSNTFIDTWFEMTEVVILNTFGDTEGGEINFYANGTSTNPLLVINFESGYVSRFNFGADEMFVVNNVIITGSEITGELSEEEFSFSFANLANLEGSHDRSDGFTATAAFTSSAIPEPATMAMLTLAGVLLRRKKIIHY